MYDARSGTGHMDDNMCIFFTLLKQKTIIFSWFDLKICILSLVCSYVAKLYFGAGSECVCVCGGGGLVCFVFVLVHLLLLVCWGFWGERGGGALVIAQFATSRQKVIGSIRFGHPLPTGWVSVSHFILFR